MYKIRNYLILLILGLIIFLSETNSSYASVIYSNDFTSSLIGYQEYFNHCVPSTIGLTCSGVADEQYLSTFPSLTCISADFTNPDNIADQLALTDGTSLAQNAVTITTNYQGHIGLYTANSWPTVNSSKITTPTGKHNYMLCKDNYTYTGYLDNNPIVSLAESGHNPISFMIGDSNNVTLTNFVATDSPPTPPQPSLSVPLIKQTDSEWKNMTYDLATIWSPTDYTIGTWGCALTSATMVLNYYNIHKIPGTNLDMNPGNLNTWLGTQPDGYIPNGNVNWLALQRLTKQAKANNPTFPFDALEYTRINSADTTTLLSDLNNGNPDILEEPGHFVVATGQSNSTYTINDPYYNRTLLTDYGNTFLSLGRYIPSFTNLSYLLFTSDPSLTITLKDSQNNLVGQSYTQQPLSGTNTSLTAGNAINLLYTPQPSDGQYTLTVSSSTSQIYNINGFLYDIDGNVKPFSQTGVTDPNNPDTININFNQQNLSTDTENKIVTIDIFIKDLNDLYKLDDIKFVPYKRLSALGQVLQKNITKNNKIPAKIELNIISKFLNADKYDGIDNTAYQILNTDVIYLKNNL